MPFSCQVGASVHGVHSSLVMKISTTDCTESTDKKFGRELTGTSVYLCHSCDGASGCIPVSAEPRTQRSGVSGEHRLAGLPLTPLRCVRGSVTAECICCGSGQSDLDL